jgi:MFS transporter, FLVCR family, MFS-domain-containing protein 7
MLQLITDRAVTVDYDTQALIIAAIFTAIALPTPFLPKTPPTPPSYVASTAKLTFWASIRSLSTNPLFYIQFIAFSVLVGAVDTATNLTTQSVIPYGYTQLEGGYALACLILVGIAAALIVSPILDRTRWHERAMKVFIVCLAASYTASPFVLGTHSVGALYAIYALIGIFSLSIEPCVLEFQASRTHPVSPEFSSVVCWSGAKVTGAIFTVVVGEVLVMKKPEEGQPTGSLFNGLLVIAGAAWASAILVLMTGYGPFKPREESKVKGNI